VVAPARLEHELDTGALGNGAERAGDPRRCDRRTAPRARRADDDPDPLHGIRS
jgi:hypothetical protein